MDSVFDPYHKWLGIPLEEQPPNHYRLLGLRLFEHDADVIDGAADRAMAHVRGFQNGSRASLSQRMLTELTTARLCLLDVVQRDKYDATIRDSLKRTEPVVHSTPPPPGVSAVNLPVTAQLVPEIEVRPDVPSPPVPPPVHTVVKSPAVAQQVPKPAVARSMDPKQVAIKPSVERVEQCLRRLDWKWKLTFLTAICLVVLFVFLVGVYLVGTGHSRRTKLANSGHSTPTGESFTNSVGMKLVKIPAGEFRMGSGKSAAEIARRYDSQKENHMAEHPQHPVGISKSFYLATTEVTQGQWKVVMKTTPWKGESSVREGRDYAASYVSWKDAVDYCRLLSEKEDRNYRLPTEAQWEFACRGGTATVYSFGDDVYSNTKNFAWFDGSARGIGEKYAHKVGMKYPNAWGLYDMHGNVFEWCSDWYGEYGESPSVDPQGPSSGAARIARGGSWASRDLYCRSAYRDTHAPSHRSHSLGFRVACEID